MTESKKRLLFVCGFPSGGTDLTKTILNAHPDIFLNGEMPDLQRLSDYGYSHFSTIKSADDINTLHSILKKFDPWNNIEKLNKVKEILISKIQIKNSILLEDAVCKMFSNSDKIIWGNKTPQYTENIDKLHNLFPNARFLIITRDVRDVCLSWKNKWGKNMVLCSSKWAARMKKGKDASVDFSDLCLFVSFEELLADTNIIGNQICKFLNIAFSEKMLEHHKYTKENPGKINYGKPIDSKNTNKWKNNGSITKKTIKRIEEIAFDTMDLLGYTPEYVKTSKTITFREKIYGRLHDLMSMLFIGNRADPDNHLFKRLYNLKIVIKNKRKKIDG